MTQYFFILPLIINFFMLEIEMKINSLGIHLNLIRNIINFDQDLLVLNLIQYQALFALFLARN